MIELVWFIVRKVVSAALTLLVAVSIVFFFMRLAGDPAQSALGENATPEALEQFRERNGFDEPVMVQYVHYLEGLLHGDVGESLRYHVPALPLVLDYLPATIQLGVVAVVLSLLIAIPVGVLSARRPGSWVDNLSRLFAVAGQSLPIFFLGIALIILFAVEIPILPAFGIGGWEHLVLPGVALSIYAIPITMRMVRSSMLDVINHDFVVAARARGLSERRVTVNYALRNAAIPVITVVGLRVGHVLSGTVVIEEVFAYPGIGRLSLESMRAFDYAVIQAFVLVVATMIIAVNLTVDLLYGVLDPRVRIS